ncbi:hypothetical protein [Lacimicrobium alkaliphilum]|uniref:Secreted protein n=1 Tax=Lacimicrobium alkaliphilum TaxID=1526571 RepID=A0ABQ1RA37_9ALTE|nr:hypothetical protein [Lacimicrobium alkaliphilum]GGD63638.1 hypothetical protein GCM10011357_18690 [Lacimicrobium alkaliphilum]
MKNFTRLITLSLALIAAQQASADQITNKEWVLQQGNDYIREAVINLDIPVLAELKRQIKTTVVEKNSSMLAKNETRTAPPVKTSASE